MIKYKIDYLQIYTRKKKGPAKLLTEINLNDLGISNNKLETIILRFRRAHRLKNNANNHLELPNGIQKKKSRGTKK